MLHVHVRQHVAGALIARFMDIVMVTLTATNAIKRPPRDDTPSPATCCCCRGSLSVTATNLTLSCHKPVAVGPLLFLSYFCNSLLLFFFFGFCVYFFGDNNIESSLQTSLASLGNGQQVNSLTVAAFAGQKTYRKETEAEAAAAAAAAATTNNLHKQRALFRKLNAWPG